MKKNKKHLDFELNLVPFIDLLSVCICFLLLTAVWIQIGSMNVKQSVGGSAAEDSEQKPVVWVSLNETGEVSLNIEKSRAVKGAKSIKIAAQNGKTSVEELNKILVHMREQDPLINTALIRPQAKVSYEAIIELMDEFKKTGMTNLGIVPL